MPRLVVYTRSSACPDMVRFRRWLRDYEVDLVEIDVGADHTARDALRALVGHASVPTLVAAEDGRVAPIAPPAPLGAHQRTRATDRGTVLAEPHPDQIAPFLERNRIAHRRRADEPGEPDEPMARTVVDVYPITGRQLFFRVPHAWCEECNLAIRAVREAAGDLAYVEVRVRPWINHAIPALLRGWWHAPVVAVNGRLFSQGVVPDVEALREAIDSSSAG